MIDSVFCLSSQHYHKLTMVQNQNLGRVLPQSGPGRVRANNLFFSLSWIG